MANQARSALALQPNRHEQGRGFDLKGAAWILRDIRGPFSGYDPVSIAEQQAANLSRRISGGLPQKPIDKRVGDTHLHGSGH